MSGDRIVLHDMRFQARHGVHPREREHEQPFHIDVELWLDGEMARSVPFRIAASPPR